MKVRAPIKLGKKKRIVDKESFEFNKNYASKVIKNLNEENRSLILNVKNSIINEEGKNSIYQWILHL